MNAIKIALAIAISAIIFTGGAKQAGSETVIELPPEPQTVEQLVHTYALKYKVSEREMMETIHCENRDLDTNLRSENRYTKDHPKWGVKKGEQEKSYGLVQIHLPDHPDVSLAEATDPEFSIEFMAKKFSEGHQKEWMCYKQKTPN